MKPLQGEWKEEGRIWETIGSRPPAGWYLRSLRQYDIGSFAFEVKRASADDVIFIYLRDWQIVIRSDTVTARFSGYTSGEDGKRGWSFYWFTATRPIELAPGAWAKLEVEALPMGIELRKDGVSVLKFTSPEEEWGERVRKSGKYPAFKYAFPTTFPSASGGKQILVLQAYGSGMAVRGIEVQGTDVGEAEHFHQDVAEPAVIAADEDLPTVRPEGVAQVDWQLDAAEREALAKLPPVASWEVPESAFVATNSDSVNRPQPGETVFPEVMRYSVGAQEPGAAPKMLALRKRAATMPQEFQVAFNLASAGTYTLQYDWGNRGMGWGPHIIEIAVDGKPVVREVYRGLNKFGVNGAGQEWIPLALSAGPHVVSLRMVTDDYGYHIVMKLLRFPLRSVRLEPGVHEPWVEEDVRKPSDRTMKSPAIDDSLLLGDRTGAALNYRLTGLVPGKDYRVILTFKDEESTRPESRIMQVVLNSETVESHLDLFKEAGWGHRLDRTYPVKAVPSADGTGQIEIRVKGGKRKAILSGVTVLDAADAVVFRDNVGWQPALVEALNRRMNVPPAKLLKPGMSAEPPKWTPEEIFDGHNLVANPHFSLVDQARGNKPQFWLSGPEMAGLEGKKGVGNPFRQLNLYPGPGEFVQDATVGKSHPGSMRVGKTDGDFALVCNQFWVDPNKRQKFSFQVKGEAGSKPVRAVMLWFAGNADGELIGGTELQFLGAAKGDPVVPGADWKEVFVDARPPAEAYYVACVIEASGNEKPLWIDDAELNGYGAEPIEFTRSLAGYHPEGDKKIIVKSFSGDPVRWTLSSEKGEKVAAGELKENTYEWFSKRYYFPLDFSSVRQAGAYRVQVNQGNHQAEVTVELKADVYDGLARLVLKALHMKRVNYPVENAHDAELLDYASVPETVASERHTIYEPVQTGQKKDLIGGYYDAGDMIKHTEFWPSVALATFNAMERADNEADKKAAQSEWEWLFEAYHKFFLPDGTQYTTAKPQGFELDNIPLYASDPAPAVVLQVGQAAGACAMAAWKLRETNPTLSRRYHEIAETCYENFGYWKVVRDAGEVGPNEVSAAAKALWAEMYLAKFPDGSRYADRLEKTCAVLAEGLKKRAYADLAEMSMGADKNGAAIQDCVWVAALFARKNPDHPGVPALKEGLRAFVDHVKELSAESVWGQAAAMNGVVPGEPLRRYPQPEGAERFRQVGYWSMLAYTLAEAGLVLEDPEAIRLAERQLQWCLGKNPSDLSAVSGVSVQGVSGGDKLFQQDQFFLHWLKSPDAGIFLPGNAVTTAWRGPGEGKLEAALAPLVIYPKGYPKLPAQPNYAVKPGLGGETYLPLIAQFNLAATSVAAGMKWIEAHEKANPSRQPQTRP